MQDSNPFDEAIDDALRLSSDHSAAQQLVQELVDQLADSVRRKTNGTVSVELITEARAQTLGELMLGFKMPSQPQVGKDKEDQAVRKFVIASGGNERRALWAVTFSDAGFPITFRGPEEDASATLFAEQDLRAAFTEAARNGRVGRKLSSLIVAAERVGRDEPTSADQK